jgi:hypothetical protein
VNSFRVEKELIEELPVGELLLQQEEFLFDIDLERVGAGGLD